MGRRPRRALTLFESTEEERLSERYLALCREALPQRAALEWWPLREDHCFARVILDEVFDGVWYDHIAARPAYRALTATQLRAAVAVGESILEHGRSRLEALNCASLRRRGKA